MIARAFGAPIGWQVLAGDPAARPAQAAPRPTFAVPRTKLQPPRPRADLLPRPHLAAELRRAIGAVRLALVAAPAGAGKTTLLAQALAHGERRARSAERPDSATSERALRSAWLSLDEHDDELPRFLAALAAACRQLAPDCGATALALLEQAQPAGVEVALQVVEALADDLHEWVTGPAALVLDDLHALCNPAIYAALTRLIDLLPPALTLVVATRHEPPLPLHRWRVRGELAELPVGALRFTRAESDALFSSRLPLPLLTAELAALHAHTEGWAAGLGLLAASLERIGSTAERATFLGGLERLDRSLYAYLVAEVLERQDPFVRMFLLETATLRELTPALCAAITGRDDAGAILDELYRRNLFLVELAHHGAADPEAPTYRYHDLFRQALRERLRRDAPEWASRLALRAAQAEAALAGGAERRLPEVRRPTPSEAPPARDAAAEALTGRELEVLRLLAAGQSNQAIADRLVISLHTAKRHVANILEKLGAASRTEAAARAHALGLA